MSEVELPGRVQKVDQWGWLVATAVTMGLFFVSLLLTGEDMFSVVVAAFAGIGVQYLLPYYARISLPSDQQSRLKHKPGETKIHQGGAGVALIVGSLIAFAIGFTQGDTTIALWGGMFVVAVSYVVAASVFP